METEEGHASRVSDGGLLSVGDLGVQAQVRGLRTSWEAAFAPKRREEASQEGSSGPCVCGAAWGGAWGKGSTISRGGWGVRDKERWRAAWGYGSTLAREERAGVGRTTGNGWELESRVARVGDQGSEGREEATGWGLGRTLAG
ncbi:hypothetical protein L7F22_051027 [Adiantum nelumboides]|nr:hypothetical protein [Adiantum nelumboides]